MVNRRHTFVLALVLALASAWAQHASAADAATGAVRIRGVDVTSFPQVKVTVSITGTGVRPQDVHVTEQNKPVSAASVEPLSESGRGVDVVLALDVSNSMAGQPLASAIAAALKFVTTMPGDGSIRVGIVTFADHPRVVQPITGDGARALQALGSLSASPGTALYDAVVAAAHMFAGSAQRNIVLLSDGGDRSSHGTFKDAVAAAKAAHAAVFSIGLQSPDTDVRALRSLSRSTGAGYAAAGTADLSSVYAGLATELSHQFVVTYRSSRTDGGQVAVGVSVAGAADSALVLEPNIQPPPAPPASPAPPGKPFLGGDVGLLVVLGLAFAALFTLLTMILGARSRFRRDRELVRRVASSPEPVQVVEQAGRSLAGWIPEPMVHVGERVAEVAGVGTKLALSLERAGLPLRPGEFVAGVMLSGLLGVLVGGLLLHNPIFMLLIGAGAAAIPVVWMKIKIRKRSTALHGQLADILMILASSLRAGHGFFQALDLVAKEVGEPGSQEFGRVVAEVRLGRPVDEALNAMAERVGSDDFRWAVLGVNIQREVGGNLAEILDTIADTVRERDTVRRQVQVLSSEGRLSISILTALPFLVSLYIAKVNPGYLDLLFSTRVGLVMVVTAVALLCVGIFWMRKIVNIDV